MKKIVSMLLAVAMIASLAACGNGDKPASSTPVTPSTPSTSTPSTPAEPSKPAEPIKLTVGVPANTVVVEWEENDFTKMLEEKTGYDIEFVYFSSTQSEYKTQVTTQMAGGDKLPDILLNFALSTADREAFGKEGVFVDLRQFYNDEEFMSQFQWYQTMQKDFISDEVRRRAWTEGLASTGEWWGAINEIGSKSGDTCLEMVYINQTWLDKLGLEIPTTLDELTSVLRAFKTQDPNGNGKSDEIPMLGSTNIARGYIDCWLINNFIYYNRSYFYNVDESGKVYRPEVTDEYREGLKYVKSLYDEGLLSPLTWTIKDRSEIVSILNPADGISTVGVWAGHIVLNIVEPSATLYDYVGLPPMEGSCAPLSPSKVTYYNFITTDCANPEAAFRLIMAMGDDDAIRQQRYGTEGVDWHWETDWETGVKGLKIDNSSAFSSNTTSTYAFTTNIIYGSYGTDYPNVKDVPPAYQATAEQPDESNPTWLQARNNISWDTHTLPYWAAGDANNPDEVIFTLTYTADETDERTSINTDCSAYIKTARAEFITGTRNVNDDKAWEQYKKDLDGMGFQRLIEIAQAAYDRSKG